MIHHIVRHSRSATKRGLISFVVVGAVMTFGTAGLHSIEGIGWLKAFYYMSMIATAQGPTFTPNTDAGLLFVSVMAFISVGVVLTALGFLFGPFFGLIWRVGIEKIEGEIMLLKKEKK